MASEAPGQSPSRPIAPCLEAATLQQLLDLDDGQTALLAELVGLFKDDTPSRLEGLRAGVAEGNATAVSELAHAVKGAAGTIGASRMRTIAQAIEKAGKEGRLDPDTVRWIEELHAAYTEACLALEAFITG